MAERRIGRKPKERRGLFSIFAKERKHMAREPIKKRSEHKVSEVLKPQRGKRPVGSGVRRPLPSNEELRRIHAQYKKDSAALKTAKGKLKRESIEKRIEQQLKILVAAKRRGTVKTKRTKETEPEVVKVEVIRPGVMPKTEHEQRNGETSNPLGHAQPKATPKLDEESALRKADIIRAGKSVSSKGSKITSYELDEQWGYKKKWLEPLRSSELNGMELVNNVRHVTGLNTADAAKLIEEKFGKNRLEMPETKQEDFLELTATRGTEKGTTKLNFPEFEKKFNVAQSDIEATVNSINFQLAGDFERWKTTSEAERQLIAENAAKKANVSPELAYAAADAAAKTYVKKTNNYEKANLASSAESKLIKSYGGPKRFAVGIDKYVERLRAGNPRGFASREQLISDFERRGLTKKEAEAFIDNHKYLGMYSIEVEPVIKEIKQKLKISADDLIRIHENLEKNIVNTVVNAARPYTSKDPDYAKRTIEGTLHKLYQDIAEERGLDYSVVAAIGNQIYKEKEPKINEWLKKARENERKGHGGGNDEPNPHDEPNGKGHGGGNDGFGDDI